MCYFSGSAGTPGRPGTSRPSWIQGSQNVLCLLHSVDNFQLSHTGKPSLTVTYSVILAFGTSPFNTVIIFVWNTQTVFHVVLKGHSVGHELLNNYSTSVRWIWIGYNHIMSNKREWNNCFIKIASKIGHFRVPLCLCFKASLSAKPLLWNDFDLHENETACRTHFHMKGFVLSLVLKQAQENSEMVCSRVRLPYLWSLVQWLVTHDD